MLNIIDFKLLLVRHNIKQQDLSKESGVSKSHLNYFLNGKTNLGYKSVFEVLKAYDKIKPSKAPTFLKFFTEQINANK